MRIKFMLLLLLPLGLVSCLAGPAQTPAPIQSDEPATTTQATAEQTELPATEAALSLEIEAHCLDCHTDQERLIQTADAVEEAPDESSGVG